MEKDELFASLATKKVSSCDTGTFGYTIGHLYDHGCTEEEILALAQLILDGIAKVKANPDAFAALKQSIETAGSVGWPFRLKQ